MGESLCAIRGCDLRLCVARGGVEPPTFRFSVGRSYQLSYLADRLEADPVARKTIP